MHICRKNNSCANKYNELPLTVFDEMQHFNNLYTVSTNLSLLFKSCR